MDDSLLNKGGSVFDLTDPYAVSSYVNQHIGHHQMRLPGNGGAVASLAHRKLASLDLCRISYGGRARVTSPALETIYHAQLLLRGDCLWQTAADEHHFRAGDLLLINPDDPVDLTYSDDCAKLIVKLPAELIDRACQAGQWRRPAEGVRFAPKHDLQQLAGWPGLLQLACAEAESPHSMPQVQEQYTRLIALKLLALPGSNLIRQPAQSRDAGFERIRDFIERNLRQEITVGQLARLANISERSLYALFEKHAGTTPKRYLRQKKLERIHADLSDPRGNVRNVTEIALDYGFLHLGRFSRNYKDAFGELPSETLRRCSEPAGSV